MATNNKAAASFDEMIKAGRKKKDNERLAQEIFGKRRASTPSNVNKKSALGGSLASRVGVTKRPASLSRSQSSQARLPQARAEREPPRQKEKPVSRAPKSNGYTAPTSTNNNGGLSIKGAAGGPYVVTASNFAPETTAADIESVMASVGGEVLYCKLVAASPTVIAEMAFKERAGADSVISTFNNKKADGRVLYVHLKENNTSFKPAQPEPQVEPETYNQDDVMEVDENTRSREVENKLREERRGGNDNRGRPDAFPSGPRNTRVFQAEDDYYYNNNNNRGPPQAQPGYQDGRYGYGGGGYGGRGSRGGNGGFYEDRRGFGRGNNQWRN